MARQAAIRSDTFAAQTRKAGFTFGMMQDSLFQTEGAHGATSGGLRSLVENFNEDFNELMNTTAFRNASVEDKLTMLFDKGFDILDGYMKTGGFDKLMNIFGQVTTAFAEFVTKIITDPNVIRAITNLGGELIAGITKGMIQGIPTGLVNLFSMIVDPFNMFDKNMAAVLGSKQYATGMEKIQKDYDIGMTTGSNNVKEWVDNKVVDPRQEDLLIDQVRAFEESKKLQAQEDLKNYLLAAKMRGELDLIYQILHIFLY